jgi:hypothetical protein
VWATAAACGSFSSSSYIVLRNLSVRDRRVESRLAPCTAARA